MWSITRKKVDFTDRIQTLMDFPYSVYPLRRGNDFMLEVDGKCAQCVNISSEDMAELIRIHGTTMFEAKIYTKNERSVLVVVDSRAHGWGYASGFKRLTDGIKAEIEEEYGPLHDLNAGLNRIKFIRAMDRPEPKVWNWKSCPKLETNYLVFEDKTIDVGKHFDQDQIAEYLPEGWNLMNTILTTETRYKDDK